MTDEDRAKIQQVMQQVAAQVLQQEQTEPGQDPELIKWANDKLAGVDSPLPASAPQAAVNATSSIPVPQPPAPSQPPLPPAQASEPEVTPDGSEGVLHIRQTPGETIQPTAQHQGGTASNDTQDNGERNGNSN